MDLKEPGGYLLEIHGSKMERSLNVAATELAQVDYRMEFRKNTDGPRRGEAEKPIKKRPTAVVNAVTLDAKENETALRAMERAPRKSKSNLLPRDIEERKKS